MESLAPGEPAPQGVIPLCVPEIRGNEWRYIKECLDTNWVSSVGSFVDRIEQMTADYVGAEHAVAAVNGTAALHIALLVAGIQPDDEILVSTLAFIAPVNAIRYVGAWPVFMDSKSDYWQMDPQKVVDFLDHECYWSGGSLHNKVSGRCVKAILPVHILGHPVDMEVILEAARKYNLIVIEDAAEGLGAKYKGCMVGHLGDIACLSFNGNKIITTGGGGMIVTDNEAWAARARYLTTQAKDDRIEYIHNDVGYNYRLTNIQAALGVAQMEQLDAYIDAKRRNALKYAATLNNIVGIAPLAEASWGKSTFWMFTALVDEEQFGLSSRGLIEHLSHCQIQARPLWLPAHRQMPYLHRQSYKVKVADRLYDQAISLPSSVGISEDEIEFVVDRIREVGSK